MTLADADLFLVASGTITLGGTVGMGTHALDEFSTSADGGTAITKNVRARVFTASGAGVVTLPGFFGAPGNHSIVTSGNQTYNAPIRTNPVDYNVLQSTDSGSITFNAPIEGPSGNISLDTRGTVTVNDTVGATSAVGSFNFNNQGTLVLKRPTRVDSQQSSSGVVDVTDPLMTGFTTVTADGPYFVDEIQVGASSTPLTINSVSSGTFTVAGGMTGSRPITLAGPGTLKLDSSIAYTGTISTNSGRVRVTSTAPAAAVALDGTGTLTSVNGAIGDVSIAASGTVSPGTFGSVDGDGDAIPGDAKTLSTGNLDLTPTGLGTYEADAEATGTDQLDATGTVDITGTTLEVSTDHGIVPGYAGTLISNDGVDPIVGTFDGLVEGATFAQDGYTFTITYVGGPGANDVVLTTPKVASTPALTFAPSASAAYGTALTITFTLDPASPGAAGGAVDFAVSGQATTTVALGSGNTASLLVSKTVGSYTVSATYSGSATHATSTVASTPFSVIKADPTPALAIGSATDTYGTSRTATATLPATATGNVTFFDGATPITTRALTGGVASFDLAGFGAGSHSIAAQYNGDGNYNPKTSAPFTYTVAQAATSVALSASAPTLVSGDPVTFTANVSPTAAPGSVTFRDGATALATTTITAGVATLQTSSLAAGAHSITAAYVDSPDYSASTSNTVAYTVTKVVTTTILQASGTGVPGSATSLMATVSPTSAAGTVTFRDGATDIGTSPVAGGIATLSTSTLSEGTHALTAVYNGSGTTTTSTSPVASFVVAKVASTTSLQVTGSSLPGSAVKLAANVKANLPTGTVTFRASGVDIGSAPLIDGTATLTTSTLAIGSHTLTAVYGGDSRTTASTSAAFSFTVAKQVSTTSLQLAAASVVQGATATFTATVAPASTGTVQFYDGDVLLGTSNQVAGVATFATSSLAVGAHSIRAVSLGTDTDLGSSSTVSPLTVMPAITTFAKTTGTVTITTTKLATLGFLQKLTCAKACTTTIQLTITAAQAKALGLLAQGSTAKTYVVGTIVVKRSAAGAFTTTVQLTAKAKAKIKAATKVVVITQTTTVKVGKLAKVTTRVITVRPGK
ncbi:MAG: hypothetical protein JWM98_2351 [Thermoleophilia bacterium]|nr:hypothetical protein [Thermoleophilia bacterium]